MAKKQHSRLMGMVIVGVLSALVFALSWVSIPFADGARLHLGNVMCLVSGVIFGPLAGGMASGIGSMLFDFTNPIYFSDFWITFLTKFAMGFIAGLLANKLPKKIPNAARVLIAGLVGQITYIILYLGKNAIQQLLLGSALPAIWGVVSVKGITSLINGAVAVVACTLLAPPLSAALKAAKILNKNNNK